jgi:hypothetical protein
MEGACVGKCLTPKASLVKFSLQLEHWGSVAPRQCATEAEGTLISLLTHVHLSQAKGPRRHDFQQQD